MSEYDEIAVIGSGSLTVKVAEYLAGLGRQVTLVSIIELAVLSRRHAQPDSGFREVRLPRADVADFLLRRARDHDRRKAHPGGKPYLVLSVENLFVFPEELVCDPCLEIINYHNSLLPRHRGMYAEAWAIFDGDAEVGFTWHRVEPSVDSGDMIVQHTVLSTPRDISLALLRNCSKRALASFQTFFRPYELGILQLMDQEPAGLSDRGRMSHHHATDRPNGGVLDTRWELPKISAFLRSFDYGKLGYLGSPTVDIGGRPCTWNAYQIAGDIPLPCTTSDEAPVRRTPRPPRCLLDHMRRRIVFEDEDGRSVTLEGVEHIHRDQHDEKEQHERLSV